jgi:hypothetical protein
MLAEGQQELLHALHYNFVKVMPPSYDAATGKFACSPSEELPEGGFSPLLPFCIALYPSGNSISLQQRLEAMAQDMGNPDNMKLAGLLLTLCGQDPGMGLGMSLEDETYGLNYRSKMLLGGAAVVGLQEVSACRTIATVSLSSVWC